MPTGVVLGGQGDVTEPNAWQDAAGNVPPTQYSNVPFNVNYPLNGDGRYWFTANANASLSTFSPITFIGNKKFISTGSGVALQWSVVQAANDGSTPQLAYSTTASVWSTVTLTSAGTQLGGIQNGVVNLPFNTLTSVATLQVQVYTTGGSVSSTASLYEVAVAITRNDQETISWDSPSAFDPTSYNPLSNSATPTATLAALRLRILIRLGFANQAANPPPGMASLINDFLTSSQTFLYKRYLQLFTNRLFRWKINPGQRFYAYTDNDDTPTGKFTIDPLKALSWIGIQDTRNVWYPMIQGIPPELYTMITKPWRPARYEFGSAIEVYPMPDQTYYLWAKGCNTLTAFLADSDSTSMDSELVFLRALGMAKAHYGQPDAKDVIQMANDYKAELIAGTHQTSHYLPGTIAVPPAVRPTLIQFGPQGS